MWNFFRPLLGRPGLLWGMGRKKKEQSTLQGRVCTVSGTAREPGSSILALLGGCKYGESRPKKLANLPYPWYFLPFSRSIICPSLIERDWRDGSLRVVAFLASMQIWPLLILKNSRNWRTDPFIWFLLPFSEYSMSFPLQSGIGAGAYNARG